MISLREYQEEAVSAFFEGIKHGQASGVICAPTGSGKSIILAEIARRVLEGYTDMKIIVATHVYELLEQNAEKFHALCPDIPFGIYSAGLKRKDTKEPIIFAGIQSAAKRNVVFDFGKVDILIVDECHRINTSENTQYGNFIANLRRNNPKLILIGLSATPYRQKDRLLWECEDALFKGLYYEISIRKLIDLGFLSPVISIGGVQKIDLTDVHIQAGDYNLKELEVAANKPELTKSAVTEILKYSENRKSVIIFCTGIQHAIAVKDEIISRGEICHVITGETPTEERDQLINDFKARKFKYLTNVNVLTTGFDNPKIDVIALLLATKSCAKYVQMVGRGMRIADGKENCLLLDFGSNVIRHGYVDDVVPPNPASKGGDGEAPVKECQHCMHIVHASAKECPECGYKFPVKDPHGTEIYTGDVISKDSHWVTIDQVDYIRHQKIGKPDSVRINFFVNERHAPYPLWLLFDHGGFPSIRAKNYVKMVGGTAETTDEALKECVSKWAIPTRIEVKKNKESGFWEIVNFDFPE